MRPNLSIVLLATVVVVGCTATRPFTMSCATLGSTAAGLEQRIDLGDFSVSAPKNENWCLGLRNSSQIVFVTHPLMGQHVDRPVPSTARNTIVLGIQKVRLGATNLATADEFHRFVGEWMKRGMVVNVTGSEPVISDAINSRFTMVHSEIEAESLNIFQCIRYEYIGEEMNNPIVPNVVLIEKSHGLICRHPIDADYLVIMGLSERHERGRQIDPGIFGRLEIQDAKAFFQSLEFAVAH